MSVDFASKMAALGRMKEEALRVSGPVDLDQNLAHFLDDILDFMDFLYSGGMGEALTPPWPKPEGEPVSLARLSRPT